MQTLGDQLDLVNASIEYTLTGNVNNYKMGEQEVYRLPLKELNRMQTYLHGQIRLYGRDHTPGVSEIHTEADIEFGS